MARYSGPPHVALIVETSTAFGRGLLRGVGDYLRENGPWSVYVEQRSIYDPAPPWLKNWDGDGIISRAAYPELAQIVLRAGIPVVDTQEQVLGLGLPRIVNDNEAIGRMAAEHLLERGFRHFGFIGYPGIGWSDGRCGGFRDAVAASGRSCEEYAADRKTARRYHQRSWEKEMDEAAAWIQAMPKPVGIMACNDYRAVQLLDACRRARVAVPEQVAVIGVDNEDVACELANPTLSSVMTDSRRIGHEAAATLDAMMRGVAPCRRETLVPPLDIVTRQSTEATAIADPLVAQAMQFVRQHACDGINVEELLRHVVVSRSVLQRRFQEHLGKTIHEAILDERLRRVKKLLAETAFTLPEIAVRTGFKHSEYLSVVFREHVGVPASQYRRAHRRAGSTRPEAAEAVEEEVEVGRAVQGRGVQRRGGPRGGGGGAQ